MAVRFRQEVVELPPEDCKALLARNNLGRMAFSFHDQVDIRPMNYVFTEGWIFGRTSQGEKLRTLQHNRWVAFQVDEIRGPWDWESVVVRGAVHLLDPPAGPEDRKLHERALHALRSVVAETLTEADPAPRREILFGLAPQEMTGRRCSRILPEGP